jgi:hypothetical protein
MRARVDDSLGILKGGERNLKKVGVHDSFVRDQFRLALVWYSAYSLANPNRPDHFSGNYKIGLLIPAIR